jgi:ribosomal protein S18 acetylase RimI-like enzyme
VRILCDSRGVCFGGIMGHGVSETTGYIYQLAVHPAHQQQGHGGHLMWSLLSVMAAAGIKAVLLGVTKESVAAGLYVALGFRVKHAVPVYTWDKNNR